MYVLPYNSEIMRSIFSNFQLVIIIILNIHSQYSIKFEIEVQIIFGFLWPIVNLDFL